MHFLSQKTRQFTVAKNHGNGADNAVLYELSSG